METVSGKTAFITGGAGSIGFGMAQMLAEAGANIVIADVNADGAAEAAARLQATGGKASSTVLNVTDPSSWEAALDNAEAAFGKVHILCNNAGVTGSVNMTVAELTEPTWVWVRSINLDGVVHGIRAFLPRVTSHGEPGHIVNTGSMASVIAIPKTGDYTVTKFGVAGLSEVLRQELETVGIGVSVLCPGVIRSSIIENSRRTAPPSAIDPSGPGSRTAELDLVMAEGMDPRLLGKLVHRAILDNRAYIFTHPEYKPMIAARFDAILADADWAAAHKST